MSFQHIASIVIFVAKHGKKQVFFFRILHPGNAGFQKRETQNSLPIGGKYDLSR